MKLYSADLSPFAARARLAIYAKGCPVEIVPPPEGGLKTPQYLAINPMGKVPALVLDDGTVIPESDTIVEYLEEVFTDHPLRPADPEGRAKVRLIERVIEIYIAGPLQVLFGQTSPKTRDQALTDASLEKLETGLGYLDGFLGEGPYAAGKAFTTADCEAIPILFFVNLLGPMFGRAELIAGHPKVAAYWEFIGQHELAQKVSGEMMRGLASFRPAA
jgi:glutathione S-transferase